jgi:GDP-mannose transporter
MGFMVSFASIFCMARTSPTIYSLTGSLNKASKEGEWVGGDL